ncbi:MAG: hypothetical protein IT325_10010 [Anaerolineae bacterium]|nr:hypothetical protein [Anaerolineae bacterium]
MRRVADFSAWLDRAIVVALALVLIGVLGVLAASVARQSGVDAELQQSLETLQDTSSDLLDTVEQLRANSDDPGVLLSLEEIDEKLESVSDQLDDLGNNLDEPLLAVNSAARDAADPAAPSSGAGASHSALSRALTAISWGLGGLSILLAIVLAVALRRRQTVRRRR